MKIDRKALAAGAALVAAIPALLFYQSSNRSEGTSPGFSRYNADHFVSILNEFLYKGQPAALDLFCDHTLGLDRNGAFAAVWIDYVAAKCGECADVHAARGRLYAYMGNREMTRREFGEARAAVRSEEEAKRIEAVIERYARWMEAASGQ